MRLTELSAPAGYERVVLGEEPASGYRALVAIHDTRLGPAVGGSRLWCYASLEEALADALRLARGMTYKFAAAELPFGGGKAVILAEGADDPAVGRSALFAAHGRFVESFGGTFVTAEDVGTSPSDMEHVRRETAHVAGLADGSGDPSPVTARGVVRAMQAAARHRWGDTDLAGRRIAVQGCGNVGYHVAALLRDAGAKVVVADVNAAKVERVVEELGAGAVEAPAIYDVDADVFAPCALGGVLDDETIPRLRAAVVAGSANNQLAAPRHSETLAARGVLYAPDYVANAGGAIHGCCRELLGWPADRALERVDAIYDTMLEVLVAAERDSVTPATAADRLAEARLHAAS